MENDTEFTEKCSSDDDDYNNYYTPHEQEKDDEQSDSSSVTIETDNVFLDAPTNTFISQDYVKSRTLLKTKLSCEDQITNLEFITRDEPFREGSPVETCLPYNLSWADFNDSFLTEDDVEHLMERLKDFNLRCGNKNNREFNGYHKVLNTLNQTKSDEVFDDDTYTPGQSFLKETLVFSSSRCSKSLTSGSNYTTVDDISKKSNNSTSLDAALNDLNNLTLKKSSEKNDKTSTVPTNDENNATVIAFAKDTDSLDGSNKASIVRINDGNNSIAIASAKDTDSLDGSNKTSIVRISDGNNATVIASIKDTDSLDGSNKTSTVRINDGNNATVIASIKDTDSLDGSNKNSSHPAKKRRFRKTNKEKNVDEKKEKTPTSLTSNFELYISASSVKNGLKMGTMLEGILRINKKSHSEAYVSVHSEPDVLIQGFKHRNRALEGDKVIVEILPRDQWKNVSEVFVQKTGKVVYIREKNHPRMVFGTLAKKQLTANDSKKLILQPRDNRLPLLEIIAFYCRNKNVDDKNIYLAHIINWDYIHYASGAVLEVIGPSNSIEAEIKAILMENEIDVSPIKNYQSYLPTIPFVIPEEEIQKRLDLRDRVTCTIDPVGAQDLDDALSCCLLPNGNYEVSVHISDVSYFINHNSDFDVAVRSKGTSVYLGHKVFHMLPEELCEICSLNPGVDKLAFSVIIEMTPDAKIVSKQFSKSIIRSRAKFTYEDAQQFIEKFEESADANLPSMDNNPELRILVKSIIQLHTLAKALRCRRFENGALSINQPKLQFVFNPETKYPEKILFKPLKESNRLIEEFMLLANSLVASYIYERFPDFALLRRHTEPDEKIIKEAFNFLAKNGIDVDISTAGDIHKSISKHVEIDIDKEIVLGTIICKSMARAEYVCSSLVNELDMGCLKHYALNIPLYTHFTSPIRRYSDIIVHRTLDAALQDNFLSDWSSSEINEIADICNQTKYAARKAEDMSRLFFLKLYLLTNGEMVADAVVLDIKDSYFDVLVLPIVLNTRLNLKKFKNVQIENVIENNVPSLIIKPESADGNSSELPEQIIKFFTKIVVSVYFNEQENKILANFISVKDEN